MKNFPYFKFENGLRKYKLKTNKTGCKKCKNKLKTVKPKEKQ
jgi:hypothetical protein